MENNTTIQVPAPFTYVSPRTGTEYTIVPKAEWRMAGGFMEDCPMYRKEYIQYNVTLDGKQVQFCFEEGRIAETVEWFENPGPDIGSRYD